MAIGVWSGVSGIAVALGPLVGGAVVQAHLLALDLLDQRPDRHRPDPARRAPADESRGPYGTLDLPGLLLACTGAFGVVFGLVRAQSLGWTSATVLVSLIGGVLLLAGFVVWELRARASRCCRCVLRQALLRGHQRGLA